MEKRSYSGRMMIPAMCLAIAFLAGCAGKTPVVKSGVMDNPRHHVFTGMNLLDKGNTDEALVQFDRALKIDEKYAPAYAGRALACLRLNKMDDAKQNAKKSLKYAKEDNHKILARLMLMQVYYEQRKEGWLDDVEGEFKEIEAISKDVPAACFFMGRVYKSELRFADAAAMFQRVVAMNKAFLKEADQEWKLVQKVERAKPGSQIGKEMALVEKITRADIAALFVEEMLLEKVYLAKSRKTYDAEFKLPSEVQAGQETEAAALPDDVKDHPLRDDIMVVLGLHIRGLEEFGDNRFYPDTSIARANFALMIEDVLVKVKNEQSLTRAFIGSNSPFPDVGSDHYAFNAIMVCTTRGILEADMDGAFGLNGEVSGADALLALRKLREELKSYQVNYEDPSKPEEQRTYIKIDKDKVATMLLQAMIGISLTLI